MAIASEVQAGKGTLTEYSYSVTPTGASLNGTYQIESMSYYAQGSGVLKGRDSASIPFIPRIYPRFNVAKATDLVALTYGLIRR
jgi:hypothetical protein